MAAASTELLFLGKSLPFFLRSELGASELEGAGRRCGYLSVSFLMTVDMNLLAT